MLPFFSHLADQHLVGSVAYFESIRQMFHQDESGGIIEIEVSDNEHWVLLFRAGKQFAAYHHTANRSVLRELDEKTLSEGEDIRFRYLVMPDHAVRSVWQALEWLPPVRAAQFDLQTFTTYLDALRVERTQAYLQVTLPEMEGFLLLIDGVPVSADTIFASGRGFDNALPNLHGISHRSGVCEIWISEIRKDTLPRNLLDIRLGMSAWVSTLLNNYRQMVGANLVIPLNHESNTWLLRQHYNIRLVGSSLVDHHLFLALPLAVEAYMGLMDCIVNHIAQVIGDRLAAMKQIEAYRYIKQDHQVTLLQFGLAPVADL